MLDPLVTIVVATYHSSKYVLETLESVKLQTWQNIELIISDDCSTDNTVDICQRWLEGNKTRFVRAELITVPQNTGVSANCNRCIRAAAGDWIKFIAGDDILLPGCMEANVAFVKENPGANAIFSQVRLYLNEFKEQSFLRIVPANHPMNIMDPGFSATDQHRLLLLSDRITFTPSVFLNKAALLSVGGYDEENRLIEDYPMWLKLTKAGNKLFFFSQPTVGYRMHNAAANNLEDYGLFKATFLRGEAFRKKDVYPHLPWDIVYAEKQVMMVSRFFQEMGMNKKNGFNTALYKLTTHYLNPFRYIIFFKKKVMRVNKTNVFYSDF